MDDLVIDLVGGLVNDLVTDLVVYLVNEQSNLINNSEELDD